LCVVVIEYLMGFDRVSTVLYRAQTNLSQGPYELGFVLGCQLEKCSFGTKVAHVVTYGAYFWLHKYIFVTYPVSMI